MKENGRKLSIEPVGEVKTEEALGLVFQHLEEEVRAQQIEGFFQNRDGNEGLWGAFREGELVGAILAYLQQGRTAFVWFPRLTADEPIETATRLLENLDEWLKEREVEMAQMLFEQISESEERILQSVGYAHLTDLLYLVCPAEEFPKGPLDSPLIFHPYRSELDGTLKQVVEATYHQTCDCPKLNGARDLDAVLEGYRSSGVFRPELWSLVEYEGEMVGCLLLADHPEYDNVELVYMGVVSGSRGRGWGIRIARFAQSQAQGLGRARLVLGVDAENQPALAMYSAVGFKAWDRRRVYWKGLSIPK